MKEYTLPDGRKVAEDVQFQIGDQVYPRGWLKTATEKEIEAIKITVEELPDPTPDPVPQETRVDSLEFMKRLTLAEYGEITKAGQAALMSEPSQPALNHWLDMVRTSPTVDVAGEDAAKAKLFLIGSGLLSKERAEEIFALPG